MKHNRRNFIRNAGLLTLCSPLLSSTIGCKADTSSKAKNTVAEAVKSGFSLDEFGIQLWTVRDAMDRDAKATIAELGSYGYHTIESYEGKNGIFWGMNPKDYKSFLADNGMKTVSSHCDSKYALDLKHEDAFKKMVDDAAEIGIKYLVNPWMAFLKTEDDFKRATDGMNRAGETCAASDIQYCYHNHAYSFLPIEGTDILPQSIMMDGTAGGPVGFQMDIYWVVAAKADPISWLNKYPNRFVMSHVKDRYSEKSLQQIKEADEVEHYHEINGSCVLGRGQINFNEILDVAKKQGMKQFIVEQERYDDMSPMDAARLDAKYMQNYVS